jgi:hypothetical protein
VIWVSWRQTRNAAIASGVAVGLIAAYITYTGFRLRAANLDPDGLARCIGQFLTQSCADKDMHFRQAVARASGGGSLTLYLSLAPALLGVFLGAPLLSREYEDGTHKLAWTQTVTRRRYLAIRVATTGAVAVAAELALSLAITYRRGPIDRVDGRFAPDGFNFEGLAPVGYALCAFMIGVVAGAALRRVVPAMAATLVAFLTVQLTTQHVLRPRFMPPLTFHEPFGPPSANAPTTGRGDWILNNENSVIYKYQPAGRFWAFQFIEFGILVGISLLLAVVVFKLVRRRI